MARGRPLAAWTELGQAGPGPLELGVRGVESRSKLSKSSSTVRNTLLLAAALILGTSSAIASEPHPGFVGSDPQPGPVADGNVKALCKLFEAIGSMQVTGAGQVGVLQEYGQTGYVSCGLSWPQEIAIMGGDSLWPSMGATFTLYRSRDLAMQAYFRAHNDDLSGREAEYWENALGTAHSHSIDFVDGKAYVSLSIGGLPERSDSMAEQMERLARQVLSRIGPTKYRISIELSTIPLQAVITVTDPTGKLAACNPVHISLDGGWPSGADNVKSIHEVLVRINGMPVSTRPSSVPGVPGVVDTKLELLPWGSPWPYFSGCSSGGRIVLPLHQLRAKGTTSTAGDQFFLLDMAKLGGLTQAGYTLGGSLEVSVPIHDDSGGVVDYASESLVFGVDHVAKILRVSDVFARGTPSVKVTRNGTEQFVRSDAAFRLRGGDTISLAPSDQVVIGWVMPVKAAIRVKEGQGTQDITMESSYIGEAYKGDAAAAANTAGMALSTGGLILGLTLGGPVGTVVGAAGTVVGVIVYFGADRFNPLDIRRLGSTMLVETGDETEVATTDGSGSVLDWTTGEYMDVHAGHSIVMDIDGSLGPIAALSVDDLGDEQMSVLDSVSAPIEDDIVTRTEGIHPSELDGEAETATPAPVVPTPEPAPVEPTIQTEPPTLEAPQDLWLHDGATVTRVDHLSGEILGRWEVSHPDCPSSHDGQAYVDADGEVAWLTIVDAEWETPVLECILRLPLDGSTMLEAYPVPTGRKPTFVNAAATLGGDLWAMIWKKRSPENPLSWYDDWSLARLDRWTGKLTQVLPRVVALAPSEAGLVVLYSEKGAKAGARRPLRLGIVEPGRRTPRKIALDSALPRTKSGTYGRPRLRLSAGHEGTVALYDEYAGREVVVFDPVSGAVIGRVTPPEGATAIGLASPVSAGVWMSGLLEGGADFVRYVPFGGWTSLVVDPCTDVAGECYAQVETASDSGAWVSAWPYDGAFELDLDRVVMRRYDTGGQQLAEVMGEEVFESR